MIHTALARKWRPKKFTDLVGQQNIIKILTNIISGDRIHHAYLLTGTRGVGKTTIARIIAKALNCLNLIDGEPCTTCDNCTQINKGSFVDVIEIDAASNTGVDNIRELIDNAQYAPTSGKYKIYIIDEVHMLSKSAFNAMLKTLEEPPAHVVFILATTDLQKVPLTILSRCLQLKLRNLLPPEIGQYLANILDLEHEEFEIKALDLIAIAANGSMRDALSILDQAIAFSNQKITEATIKEMLGLTSDEVIYAILNSLSQLDSNTLMQNIEHLQETGADLENVLLNLQQKLCELSLMQLTNKHGSTNLELSKLVNQISINDVQLYFEIASLGLEQLKRTSDKYPVFIMTLLRMLAFNIGTDEQKTLALTQSNFKVTQSAPIITNLTQNSLPNENQLLVKPTKPITQETPPAPRKDNSSVVQLKPQPIEIKQEEPKESKLSIQQPIINEPRMQFNGNWFELITTLKGQLGALYPFVENAKLKQYTASNFELIIDQRYQSALNNNLITQLTQILSTYYATPITVNIEFANQVDNTLKEKNLQLQQQKQEDAETAILQDQDLIKILDEFSAKIVPGSIKPLS